VVYSVVPYLAIDSSGASELWLNVEDVDQWCTAANRFDDRDGCGSGLAGR
jgi:hypothetical protein